MERALAEARRLMALPPKAFAISKQQIRQPVQDRLAAHGARVDAEAEAVWTAPETLAHVQSYVARTLKKT
jgi:enoyl-CoA hydratase